VRRLQPLQSPHSILCLSKQPLWDSITATLNELSEEQTGYQNKLQTLKLAKLIPKCSCVTSAFAGLSRLKINMFGHSDTIIQTLLQQTDSLGVSSAHNIYATATYCICTSRHVGTHVKVTPSKATHGDNIRSNSVSAWSALTNTRKIYTHCL